MFVTLRNAASIELPNREVCWWEATVLVRKCAVAVVIATFSATYSPMLYLSNLLMVVAWLAFWHCMIHAVFFPLLWLGLALRNMAVGQNPVTVVDH